MLRRFLLVGLMLGVAFHAYQSEAVVSNGVAKSTELNQARLLVQELTEKALNVVNRAEITSKGVQKEFVSLINDYFAVEGILRFVVGRANYEKVSDKQGFLQYFCEQLANTYSSSFRDFKNAKVEITKFVKLGKRQILVTVKISVRGKPDIIVVFSVFSTKSGLKIYDAMVDNVSISQVLKDSQSKKILQDFNAKSASSNIKKKLIKE